MKNILERLKSGEVLLGDGAMGTMLFRKGLKMDQCPEKVNLDNPEILEDVAQAYFNAGAELIETNSFGGSSLKLALYSLEDKTEEINRKAIQSVRKVIGEKAYLSFSCGPTGRILKPYGDTEPEETLASFKRQIQVAIDEAVDIICIETMTDICEAKLAIEAVKSISTTVPIISTMTFDPTPNGFFTIMGVSVEQACKELVEAGADIIGSNCGNGTENMIKLASEFKKHTTVPLIIQSNAGLPEIKNGEAIYSETPKFMAGQSQRLLDIGVNIIGGCCGTTPEHISAIKNVVDKYNMNNKKE
ncbi:MAG: methionine synthase [candidate division Zixibacteria bacterium]|nr:methionine synthase [candidate division Zixibacteria bacterium]